MHTDHNHAMHRLAEALLNNPAMGDFIPTGGTAMLDAGDGLNSVLSTLKTALKWVTHPTLADVLTQSDFNLCDLKGSNAMVFVAAEPTEIRGSLSGFFRAVCMMSLYGFEKIEGNLKHPTLFAIDEAPSLGYVEDIAVAAPLMRERGVRLLMCAQDLEKLRAVYQSSWGGLIGNAECVFWMSGNHPETFEYLSHRVLGTRIRKFKENGRVRREEQQVLTPDQLKRWLSPKNGRGNMIVQRYGKRPLRTRLAPYYETLPVTHYAPHPEFGDAKLRGWMRKKLTKRNAQSKGKWTMKTVGSLAVAGLALASTPFLASNLFLADQPRAEDTPQDFVRTDYGPGTYSIEDCRPRIPMKYTYNPRHVPVTIGNDIEGYYAENHPLHAVRVTDMAHQFNRMLVDKPSSAFGDEDFFLLRSIYEVDLCHDYNQEQLISFISINPCFKTVYVGQDNISDHPVGLLQDYFASAGLAQMAVLDTPSPACDSWASMHNKEIERRRTFAGD